VSPSSLDALRTTWQHLSTRNNWALVTDVESFLRHATEEMSNLQDIPSPAQRTRMALTRAYSALLYEQLWERSERAAYEVWLAAYRFALRDHFPKEEAEVLAQETVTLVLTKLHTLSSPASFVSWMRRVYWTVRSKTTKLQQIEIPLLMEEEQQDSFDLMAEIEDIIFSQELLAQIKKRVRNHLEITALVRCVFGGEKPHDVAQDLGIRDHRVRIAKSRALHRLQSDTDFMRFLKELVGESPMSDAEGDSDDRQPFA